MPIIHKVRLHSCNADTTAANISHSGTQGPKETVWTLLDLSQPLTLTVEKLLLRTLINEAPGQLPTSHKLAYEQRHNP
jgi:hypothetical protein